jgi:hypothetical protein
MKKSIIILVFSIIFSNGYTQGLIFDSTQYAAQQEYPQDRSYIPENYSLEKYLPVLFPQTGGTCVAMSIATARTIMYAAKNNITDVKTITRNLMSPYFIYYHSRDKFDYDCEAGLNPIAALNTAKYIGFEKLFKIEYPKYYPFTDEFLCPNTFDYLPPDKEEHKQNAKLYRISNFYVTKDINTIKSAISKKLPVILGLQIPKSFYETKSMLWYTLPYESKENAEGGHAVVAIGYDDNLFEGSIRIVNSWGDQWADSGKIWIKYKDLNKFLVGGFIMTLPISNTLKSEQNITVNENKLGPYKIFNDTNSKVKFNFSNKNYIDIFSKEK